MAGSVKAGKISPVLTREFAVMMKRLNNEINAIQGRTTEGLLKAAAHIYTETESGKPLTPIDTGNMRASYFISSVKGISAGEKPRFVRKGIATTWSKAKVKKFKEDHAAAIAEAKTATENIDLVVICGYSANYAAYVHEKLGGSRKIMWSRKGSGAKWFEAAIKRSKDNILKIIKENSTLKK